MATVGVKGLYDGIWCVLKDKELDIDPDYTTRLISVSGGFSSNVRDDIVSHPVVVKNRIDPTHSTHISTESRQVMRKGFDLGISSPGLRMLYDVRKLLQHYNSWSWRGLIAVARWS